MIDGTNKYHMRRRERQITEKLVLEEILQTGKYVTLALCLENEPYIVTLSYGYDREEQCLYFHCAKDGLKTDFVTENPVVCATVVEDHGYIQTKCEHAYRSAIIRGKVEILSDDPDKRKAIDLMIEHLEDNPGIMKESTRNKPAQFKEVQIWRLTIEEITGKEGK